MKKRAIIGIGVACLTAGIGLAGCGASNSTTETTTTAETTTVVETTTSVEMTHIIPPDVKVGDLITFGNYPQKTDGTIKPIEWQVLDVKDNRAFIISKYCLDNKLYSDEHEGVTWETCSLRSWLNGDFYNTAFSADEQKIIENTDVKNNDNPIWGTNGGNDTIDKIFLLSLDETLNYFNLTKDEKNESHAERMVYCYGDQSSSAPTQYAVSKGLYDNDGSCDWWLRSVGGSGNGALVGGGIVYGGSENVGYTGTYGRDENGVRPALWVNTEGTTTTLEETTTTTEATTETTTETTVTETTPAPETAQEHSSYAYSYSINDSLSFSSEINIDDYIDGNVFDFESMAYDLNYRDYGEGAIFVYTPNFDTDLLYSFYFSPKVHATGITGSIGLISLGSGYNYFDAPTIKDFADADFDTLFLDTYTYSIKGSEPAVWYPRVSYKEILTMFYLMQRTAEEGNIDYIDAEFAPLYDSEAHVYRL